MHATNLCRQACPDQAAGAGTEGGPPGRARGQTGHQGRGEWGGDPGTAQDLGPARMPASHAGCLAELEPLLTHTVQERLAQRAIEKEERMTHDTKRAAKDRREVRTWQTEKGGLLCVLLQPVAQWHERCCPKVFPGPANRRPTAGTNLRWPVASSTRRWGASASMVSGAARCGSGEGWLLL